MKNYSKWKDEDVISLFRFIEEGKLNNESLSKLFADFAHKTNRMPNSVRNYYYTELKCLEEDELRRKKLGIDISLHQKVEQKEFSEKETEDVIVNILKLTAKGISVRKACLTLANGNISKMVRLQNKYRMTMVKDKEMFKKCVEKLKKEGVNVKGKMPNNVVSMPDRRLLTESDINSLFLGLVKLVKKQASEQANIMLKKDNEKANDMLRKTLVNLSEKEKEIKNLRKQFKVLSVENEKLCEEVKLLRGKNAELITKQNKLNALKKFKQKFEKTEEQAN